MNWSAWLEMAFLQRALIAVILIMPLLGLMGTLVVERRMAFFSDALGHGAFAGVALGVLLGMKGAWGASLLFALVFAAAMTWVSYRSRMSADTVIGTLSASFMALGLFLATWGGVGLGGFTQVLAGDILTVGAGDLWTVAGLWLLTWFLLARFGNALFLVGIHRGLSLSRGYRPLTLDMILSALLAFLVTLSMQWVGLLTVNACLVLPAATSRLLARNGKQYLLFSMFLALLGGVLGLVLAWMLGTATGAAIVLVNAVFFFGALIWAHPLRS